MPGPKVSLIGFLAIVGIALGVVLLLSEFGSIPGDPGGRILAQLRPVAMAVPHRSEGRVGLLR